MFLLFERLTFSQKMRAVRGPIVNEMTLRKKSGRPALLQVEEMDVLRLWMLRLWMAAYFLVEVTTCVSSQAEQWRDLSSSTLCFEVRGDDRRPSWAARLSWTFVDDLREGFQTLSRQQPRNRAAERAFFESTTELVGGSRTPKRQQLSPTSSAWLRE